MPLQLYTYILLNLDYCYTQASMLYVYTLFHIYFILNLYVKVIQVKELPLQQLTAARNVSKIF